MCGVVKHDGATERFEDEEKEEEEMEYAPTLAYNLGKELFLVKSLYVHANRVKINMHSQHFVGNLLVIPIA